MSEFKKKINGIDVNLSDMIQTGTSNATVVSSYGAKFPIGSTDTVWSRPNDFGYKIKGTDISQYFTAKYIEYKPSPGINTFSGSVPNSANKLKVICIGGGSGGKGGGGGYAETKSNPVTKNDPEQQGNYTLVNNVVNEIVAITAIPGNWNVYISGDSTRNSPVYDPVFGEKVFGGSWNIPGIRVPSNYNGVIGQIGSAFKDAEYAWNGPLIPGNTNPVTNYYHNPKSGESGAIGVMGNYTVQEIVLSNVKNYTLSIGNGSDGGAGSGWSARNDGIAPVGSVADSGNSTNFTIGDIKVTAPGGNPTVATSRQDEYPTIDAGNAGNAGNVGNGGTSGNEGNAGNTGSAGNAGNAGNAGGDGLCRVYFLY